MRWVNSNAELQGNESSIKIKSRLICVAETREDRTKRLFRHYTVGSYDNFTSYRYWMHVGVLPSQHFTCAQTSQVCFLKW